MRLVSVRRLAPGSRLARDIAGPRPGAAPLLRAGVALDERLRATLLARGINAVWIDDELGAGIDPPQPVSDQTREAAATTVGQAFADARRALDESRGLGAQAVAAVGRIAQRIAAEVLASPDAALALSDLSDADAYTYRHSVNVAIGGLLIGRALFRRSGWVDFRGMRRFDRMEERLTLLGTGLLLHDVGKLVVPLSIINKRGPLDEEEWALMRSHPDAGVALLASRSISPLVHAVVVAHHERQDGSGYPRGLTGERIHQHARIAAVADTFDAITSARPYRAAAPAAAGVRAILEAAHLYDPEVLEVFRRVVPPYPAGSEVVLPDGRAGVVVAVAPDAPERPRVRVPAGEGFEELDVELPVFAEAAAPLATET